VLFHTQNTNNLAGLDIQFKLSDCVEEKDIPFFELGVITPFFENDVEYSQINVGGIVYYSTCTVDDILQEIDEMKEKESIIFKN
jgi:hypothetical protein